MVHGGLLASVANRASVGEFIVGVKTLCMSLHCSRPCLAHTDDECTRHKMSDHWLLEIVTPKSHSFQTGPCGEQRVLTLVTDGFSSLLPPESPISQPAPDARAARFPAKFKGVRKFSTRENKLFFFYLHFSLNLFNVKYEK